MEEMILCGIEKGLTTMCFTEHNDFGFPEEPGEPADRFILQPDPYLYDIIRYREKYADKIRILFGIELGLQPEVMRQNAVLAKSYDFDFIIGSSHICHGKDPYYPAFYEGRSEKEAYYEYFTSILENIKKFSNFDVYGHLDYVVRYGPSKDAEYTYEAYQDVLDDILKLLIEKGKGIELNMAGYKYGLGHPNPTEDILRRYRELGGEIITLGSDGHKPDQIAWDYWRVPELLKNAGFDYFTVFKNRKPEFIKL